MVAEGGVRGRAMWSGPDVTRLSTPEDCVPTMIVLDRQSVFLGTRDEAPLQGGASVIPSVFAAPGEDLRLPDSIPVQGQVMRGSFSGFTNLTQSRAV